MGHIEMVALFMISAVLTQGEHRIQHICRWALKSKHLESCRVSYEKCTKWRLYSKPGVVNQQQLTN